MKIFPRKNILIILILYLCLMIPIYGFSFVVNYNISDNLTINAIQQVEYRLDRALEDFESLYSELRNSAYTAYIQNPEFDEMQIQNNLHSTYFGIEILSDILAFQPNAFDVFITYADGYAYSSIGVSRESVYLTDILNISENETEKATEFINSSEDGVIFLNGITDINDMLIFHYHINQNIYFNFCIDLIVLENILESLTEANPFYLDISLGNNSNIIFYNDGINGLSKTDTIPDNLDAYIEVNNHIEDITTSFKVMNVKTELYKNVEQVRTFSLLMSALGFLISAVLAYVIYVISRKSIYNLTKNVEEKSVSGTGFWGFLETRIESIIKEGDEWKKTAEKSNFLLKQQTVFQMFNGIYRDRESVNKALEVYGQELYEEHYCIIGIIVDDINEFVSALERQNHETLFCQISLNNQKSILFLQELPNFDYSYKMREELISYYQNFLTEIGLNKSGFSVSFVHNEVSEMNTAYLETIYGLEQIAEDYVDKIKFSESAMSNEKINLSEFNESISEYHSALREKKEKNILSLVKIMNNFVTNQVISRENKTYLRYSILQPLIVVMKEDDKSEGQFEYAIKSVSKRGPEFEKEITKLITKYCSQTKHDFSYILNYINDNYHRYDLSLEEVANFAGLTKTYLSKLFKAKTGIGYIEYLSKLRMAKAKELLEETDIQLKDLVEKIGYLDVSAFRRRFKSIYGFSTSEVRNNKSK